MRIAHISDCYPPRVGGIESQVSDLATYQASTGHAVHVLTATALEPQAPNRYRASEVAAPGLKVHRLASPLTLGLPVHPRGHALVRRALDRVAPDVVHVHAGVLSPFAFDGARAARDLGLPLAITWHCMLDGVESLVRAGARGGGWDRYPFAASAVSGVAAQRVAAALGRDDVTVLPNGLDLAPWLAVGQRSASATLRVVATQRLAPRKRTEALIDIIDQAHRALGRHPDGTAKVRLSLIGGGPLQGRVESEVSRRELADVVQVLGRVPRQVLPTLYRDADVFVSPAQLEAFGIAALEARTSGLVVIGRAGTGLGEFVTDGVNGFLVESDADAAARLVRLALTSPLLQQLREANLQRPPFGWDDIGRASVDLYQRAIELMT